MRLRKQTPVEQQSMSNNNKMDKKVKRISIGRRTAQTEASSPAVFEATTSSFEPSLDYVRMLSLEILCKILAYLPLRDAVKIAQLSRQMNEAITLHLRLLKTIDFIEGEVFGWMGSGFTDSTFATFLGKCPEVVNIYGLHPQSIAKRRNRGSDELSIPGIISALYSCPKLRGIETCDIFLLEAITNDLPSVHILNSFKNRNGTFPIPHSNRFDLNRNPRITSLNLVGVVVSEIPRLDFLKHLHLKWVRLTDPHPFKDFGVPLLQTFVMSNCAGPVNALKYVPLITGLAASRSLKRMELVRVPFLGGLVQHVVEDSWRLQGFRQLQKVLFGTCKHALEVDLGYLVTTCAPRLEDLSIQPSLTKDSFFSSLTLADVSFPKFTNLHLGYVDDFPEHGKYTNEQLVMHGLADINESPSMITDIGMKSVGKVFNKVKCLYIYNCPHLLYPTAWLNDDISAWYRLKELYLRRCHAIRLEDFCRLIPKLPSLEYLCLEEMFREPPRGCSRVGLSAGTGLGVSSALVQNSPNVDLPHGHANNNNPAVAANIPVNPPPPPPAPPDDMDDSTDSDSDHDGPIQVKAGPSHSIGVPPNVDVGCESTPKDTEDGDSTCCCNQDSPSTSAVSKNSDKTQDNLDPQKDYVDLNNDGISTRLRRSSRGQASSSSASFKQTSPEQRKFDTDELECYKGKGKSLRGKKKGIVKRKSKDETTIDSNGQSSSSVDQHKDQNSDLKDSSDSSTNKRKRGIHPQCPVHSTLVKRSRGSTAKDIEDHDTSTCTRATQTMGGGISKLRLRKPNMCDQSTSTSDPVIEEDHIQDLKLESGTLKSLVVKQVGVTSISIDCPRINLINGSACRVLNKVTIKDTAHLHTVNFSQCKKLDVEGLVEQALKKTYVGELHNDRTVILRPMNSYDPGRLLEVLMKAPEQDGNVMIVHDSSADPKVAMQNRMRAMHTLSLVQSLNVDLMKESSFKKASREKQFQDKYPWGRDIYSMRGQSEGNGCWEITTDVPWIRSLAPLTGGFPETLMHEAKIRDDSKNGLPGVEWRHVRNILENDIAEARENGHELHDITTLIYINTCDLNGSPVNNIYS